MSYGRASRYRMLLRWFLCTQFFLHILVDMIIPLCMHRMDLQRLAHKTENQGNSMTLRRQAEMGSECVRNQNFYSSIKTERNTLFISEYCKRKPKFMSQLTAKIQKNEVKEEMESHGAWKNSRRVRSVWRRWIVPFWIACIIPGECFVFFHNKIRKSHPAIITTNFSEAIDRRSRLREIIRMKCVNLWNARKGRK